jgi:hypothetical protein
MADFQAYLFAALILGGIVAFWFFTRHTEMGRRALPWLILAVIVVVGVLAFKNRIPFLSSIVSWFKDKLADNRIKELKKDIKTLEGEKDQAVKDSQGYKDKAQALQTKAEGYVKQMDDVDRLLGAQLDDRNKQKDPLQDAKAAMPTLGTDPVDNSIKLTDELARRRSARRKL